jgi:peptidoglycan/xylan/chitin deacetylase (PgdA/CDA1 family)
MTRPGFVLAASFALVTLTSGQEPRGAAPAPQAAAQEPAPAYPWPEGRRAAVSLSFDDGRSSQMDAGLPVLNGLGLKVTFYVVPGAIEKRQTAWRAAVQSGHEIGNHSLMHACTGNFAWSRQKALEEYTLERLDSELERAGQEIRRITGVLPTTFAYPCGQTFVGRGITTASYVPLISKRFVAGRLWLGETANDPAFVDLSQVHAVSMDDKELPALLTMLDTAAAQGRWLVLAGHDIGEQPGPYTTRVSLLRALATYLKAPERNLWVAPVGAVASWLANQPGRPQ